MRQRDLHALLRSLLVAAATAVIAATVAIAATAGSSTAHAAPPQRAATPPSFDWPKIGHDAANSGVSADPAISTANAAATGVRWMAGAGSEVHSSPAVAWNATLGLTVAYVTTDRGDLLAFDEATGHEIWAVNLGTQIDSSPLVENGAVWVARRFSPVLYKINGATGAQMCSVPLVSVVEGSPTIGTPTGGSLSVYVGTEDYGNQSGPIYSISEADCSVNWRFSDYTSATGTWDPLSFATDGAGRSYVLAGTSDPDDSVYAVDALTGQKAWSFKTYTDPANPTTDIDVGAGVSVTAPGVNGFADGVAYVDGEDGYMYAFDLTSGALIWDTYFGANIPSYHTARATPAVVGGQVIFGESGGVMSLDAVTGSFRWAYATGGVESLSVPAVVGPAGQQVVAMTTVGGAFDLIDISNGNLVYRYQSPTYSTSSFADVDGNLLVASADGFVYDLAPGGSNSAGPSTSVTYPASGSRVANPSKGAVQVRGVAAPTAGTTIAEVDVAVQAGGPSGPWWDAATGTWLTGFYSNPVKPLSSGAWTLAVPVSPSGGVLSVLASGRQSDGVADVGELSNHPGSSHVTFTVASAPHTPVVTVGQGGYVAPGGKVTASGAGFTAGESVSLSLAGKVLKTVTAGSTGHFVAVVNIPSTASFGLSGLVATGSVSQSPASATIDILNSWTQSSYSASGANAEPNDPVLLDTVSPGPSPFLTAAWDESLGAAVQTAVVVSNDTGYYADSSGDVTAFALRTGQPLWTAHEPSAVDSTPAVTGQELIFGTQAGQVVALSTANGAQLWSTATSSAVGSSPSVTGSQVVVGSQDGSVYDLNTATGAVAWTAHLGGAVVDTPALDPARGLAIVGDSTGAITALRLADGSAAWSFATAGAVTASPSLIAGTVVVGSSDSHVYCLSEATGAEAWSTALGGPVGTSGSVYVTGIGPTDYAVASADGTVYLLNPSTGAVRKSLNIGARPAGLATTVGFVAVTTSNGQVWGLKRTMAEPIWVQSAASSFTTAPTIVDGVVLTGSADGSLAAWTPPGVPIP